MQKMLIKTPFDKSLHTPEIELSEDILHLLSRALIGLKPAQKALFVGKKKKEIIDSLFKYDIPEDCFPVKDYDTINSGNPDQKVKIGQTWVFDFNHDLYINEKRKLSLKNWATQMLYCDNQLSVGPRMFLFWSHFFGLETRKITFTSRAFQHFNILRKSCLGNYVELLAKVITDPAFLNYYQKIVPKGRKISEFATEQVLARYVLGPMATENISKEKKKRLIRLLNKWWIISDLAFLHDRSDHADQSATEPSRFKEAFLERTDAREIKKEIEYVLYTLVDQPSSAQYLTERIYQFFLGGPVDYEARQQLIVPVAEDFMQTGYDIQPWLSSLFSNKYFYDKRFIGTLVKGPVEFIFRLCKTIEVLDSNANASQQYRFEGADWLRHKCALQGLDICDPPDNKGWTATTDNNFHSSWLTPVVIGERRKFVNRLIGGDSIAGNEPQQHKKVLQLSQNCSNPSNPFQLVEDLSDKLFFKKISARYIQALTRTFLNSGSSPWSYLWDKTINSKDPVCEKMVVDRLNALLNYMLLSPEFNYY